MFSREVTMDGGDPREARDLRTSESVRGADGQSTSAVKASIIVQGQSVVTALLPVAVSAKSRANCVPPRCLRGALDNCSQPTPSAPPHFSIPPHMGNAYIFSLQPTFTQGFFIGQLFSLCLVVFVFKYLFFDTTLERPYKSSYQPRLERDVTDPELITMTQRLRVLDGLEGDPEKSSVESSEWLNVLVQQVRTDCHRADCLLTTMIAQVVEAYRAKLRDDRPGAEGEEIARQRVEQFANTVRPPGFLVRGT